jgi:hypothetical protein
VLKEGDVLGDIPVSRTSTTDKKAEEVFSRQDAKELAGPVGYNYEEQQTRVIEMLVIVWVVISLCFGRNAIPGTDLHHP